MRIFIALGICCLLNREVANAQDNKIVEMALNRVDSKTLGRTFELLGALDIHDLRIRRELQQAQGDEREAVRLFAAMALLRLREDGEYRSFWDTAISDPSKKVRDVAAVDALLRGGIITRKELDELARDENPLVRLALAATQTDQVELSEFVTDDCGFVRAAVARRCSALGATKKGAKMAANRTIEVLLTDPDAFVRGNAIAAARELKHAPFAAMRGLLCDARPFIYLTEAFDLDERDSDILALHQGYHTRDTPEREWLLLLMHIELSDLFSPEPTFPRILIPLNGRHCIGAVAADSLLDTATGTVAVVDEIDLVLAATRNSASRRSLAEQLSALRNVLGSPKDGGN